MFYVLHRIYCCCDVIYFLCTHLYTHNLCVLHAICSTLSKYSSRLWYLFICEQAEPTTTTFCDVPLTLSSGTFCSWAEKNSLKLWSCCCRHCAIKIIADNVKKKTKNIVGLKSAKVLLCCYCCVRVSTLVAAWRTPLLEWPRRRRTVSKATARLVLRLLV